MKVAVIGAGASGLVATKECLQEGLRPVCFESSESLAGLWNYCDNQPPSSDEALHPQEKRSRHRGSVFKSTETIFSRELFCFSDFPVPKEFPVYLHNTQVREYLSMYAEKFGLHRFIRFEVLVENISRCGDGDDHQDEEDHEWVVKLRDLKTGRRWQDGFDAVMICTGHHSEPYVPEVKGLSDYHGEVLHTRDYKISDSFKGKQVLVIGAGNSGADVSTEISAVATKVYLSSRSSTWILPRYQSDGLPTDILITRRLLRLLPTALQNAFIKYHLLTYAFDYEANNNVLPDHDVLSTYPTINDDLAKWLANGRIIPKPDVLHFTENGVQFQDGSTVCDIDCVIFATGYTFAAPNFLDSAVLRDHQKCQITSQELALYKHVFPVSHQNSATLAFIGFLQPRGAMNPVAEIQSRWAVQIFSGSSHLPETHLMVTDIKRSMHGRKKQFVKSKRCTLDVDSIAYMDDVAKQVGARPSLLRMLLVEDSALFLMCILGPCLAYQYRLTGPGCDKQGAKRNIREAWYRMSEQGWVLPVECYCMIMIVVGIGCVILSLLFIYNN